MMKLVILACLVVLASAAGPVQNSKEATILAEENNVNFDGTYVYSYQSSDGINARQQGQLKQVGAEAGQAVQGEFSYVGNDGQPISLTYTADENGYQPQGAHLPQSPPIPADIQKALNYLATAPPPKN